MKLRSKKPNFNIPPAAYEGSLSVPKSETVARDRDELEKAHDQLRATQQDVRDEFVVIKTGV